MGEIFDRSLTALLILIFIIWAFIEYTFFMFVVLFVILFLFYMILMKDEVDNPPSANRETNVGEGSVFLNPAKQAEYDIQKKKESEINQQQQQQKEFKKVAKKYARKNNNRAKKSQMDKNFAETGKYESDKSRKSREINELKKANNYKRKNGWFGYQHLGDWNDK